VICTHLHFDHVGWNTRRVDGVWRPTFPHARYTACEAEFRYWQSGPAREADDQRAGFADSVAPLEAAGLLRLVPDDAVVTAGLRLVPSPGHTPRHVSVLLESNGESALITGDAMHHPAQIAYPDWGTTSDFDAGQARASRHALLERFADSDTLIIGSHFTAPGGGLLRRGAAGYYLAPAG
jgi:glyoxylase-like metal-dependent hydrolase (beta-lactamase superfamily II)